MLEMGRISQNDHDAASHALPDFPDVPVNNRWQGTKGYLLKLVQDELVAQGFTESQIAGGGLKVTTTLDPKVQQAAVDAGQRYKRIAGN
ncbi:penicillin-binding protein, partial [Pseudomonas sp. GW704-F3]